MKFEFTDIIPLNLTTKAVCISGSQSYNLDNTRYLLRINDEGNYSEVFEIKYEYHCSPFEEADILGNILAVGHEAHFYLFNLTKNKNILTIPMRGYFGHLYIRDNSFYVCDAGSLIRLNRDGDILWHAKSLGIDGVTIESFDYGKIFGSGEWDPPGGWKDFILDNTTGVIIK